MTGRSAPHVVEVDQSGLRWIKSSASEGGSDNCVEIAQSGDLVLVRNSRDRSGPRLSIPLGNWIEFIRL